MLTKDCNKWGNGYVQPQGTSYAYRFYFKDHQGNNRLVTTSTGTVKQTTHYYPDGVTHDKSTGQGEQVYKYSGKELDRMHVHSGRPLPTGSQYRRPSLLQLSPWLWFDGYSRQASWLSCGVGCIADA